MSDMGLWWKWNCTVALLRLSPQITLSAYFRRIFENLWSLHGILFFAGQTSRFLLWQLFLQWRLLNDSGAYTIEGIIISRILRKITIITSRNFGRGKEALFTNLLSLSINYGVLRFHLTYVAEQ